MPPDGSGTCRMSRNPASVRPQAAASSAAAGRGAAQAWRRESRIAPHHEIPNAGACGVLRFRLRHMDRHAATAAPALRSTAARQQVPRLDRNRQQL